MAQIDVAKLPIANAEQSATAIQAARGAAAVVPLATPGPGSVVERWPVKTCQDDDVGTVAQTVVPSTVLDLGSLPRPDVWPDAGTYPPVNLQTHRVAPTETTIWQVQATVIALRLEADGDYHVVLQDSSGNTMVAECPNPDPAYIQNYNANENPYHDAIAAVRSKIDNQFGSSIQSVPLVPFTSAASGNTKLVPQSAAGPGTVTGAAVPALDLSAMTANPDTMQSFSVQITPTNATVTGIAFFDKAHGATGAAPNVIQLHPIVNITFS